MAAFDYSFPDPSGAGDSLDSGLDGSAIGLSGDPSSLDDFSGGSNLTAGGDPYGMGITDLGTSGDLFDSINLSGATESAPDPFSDGVSFAGSGSAPAAASPYDSFSPSNLLGSVEKFGSVFTSLWASHPGQPTVAAGRPGYMNPNVATPSMISKTHLLMIAVVVLVLVGIISLGDGVSA